MAEVLVRFHTVVKDRNGVDYTAQACGAPSADGRWEGWIEFVRLDGGRSIRTPRETTQPNRNNALYWAAGLSAVYLEGALERAKHPLTLDAEPVKRPIFDRPAPELNVRAGSTVRPAILDPFSVYEKGEHLMRQALTSLSAWHLVSIVVAYDLRGESETLLNQLSQRELVELIVTAVRRQSSIR
jgi:hypothetical protein